MERVCTWLLAVMSVISAIIVFHQADGKCTGKWALHHACVGGMGKRRESDSGITDNDLTRSLMLSKLLSPRDSQANDVTDSQDTVADQTYESGSTEYNRADITSLKSILWKIMQGLQDRQNQK